MSRYLFLTCKSFLFCFNCVFLSIFFSFFCDIHFLFSWRYFSYFEQTTTNTASKRFPKSNSESVYLGPSLLAAALFGLPFLSFRDRWSLCWSLRKSADGEAASSQRQTSILKTCQHTLTINQYIFGWMNAALGSAGHQMVTLLTK